MNQRFSAVMKFSAMAKWTRTLAAAAVALMIAGGVARAQMSPGDGAGAPAGAIAGAPATGPAGDLAASTQPAAAVDQTSPKGAIKVLETAILNGDSDGMLHVINAASPEENKVVNAFANNIAAKVALQDAVMTKFPPAAGTPAEAKAKQLTATLGAVDKMTVNVSGDDASVGPAGAPDESRLKLKLFDGQWKVPFSTMFGGVEKLDERVDSLNVQTGVLRDFAGDVGAGKFKTLEEMQQALQQRMIAAATTQGSGEIAPTTQGSPESAGGGATTKPGM